MSAALNLAERGYKVAVFDRGMLGCGGSGRNGGHVVQGWPRDFSYLSGLLPERLHNMAWEAGLEGTRIIRDRVVRHRIDCALHWGYLHAALHRGQLRGLQKTQDEWEARGYSGLTLLSDSAAVAKHVCTDAYCGGLHDAHSGHMHPLRYLRGLAKAALGLGAEIYEDAHVRSLCAGRPNMLDVGGHRVGADYVMLCGNAYLAGVGSEDMSSRMATVTSSVLATEPLDADIADELLPSRLAVADCNIALNYYRIDGNRRLIFGGGASYANIEPRDASSSLVRRMLRIFPQLVGVKAEISWSGKVGITVNRLPHFGKLSEKILFVQGFSGHGVAFSGTAGLVMAEHIAGESGRFSDFCRLKHLSFPGGLLRTPCLIAGMFVLKARDYVLGFL